MLMKTQVKTVKTIALLFVFTSLCMISCKSNKDEETVPTIQLSGRVFHSCNTPIKNDTIYIVRSGTSSLAGTSESTSETVVTDSLGNFCNHFPLKGGEKTISIRYGVRPILQGITTLSNTNDIVAYFETVSCIQVRLNVLHSYTSNDTLSITDLGTNGLLKIPGPFSSGVLYTAPNVRELEPMYGGTKRILTRYINSNVSQRVEQEVVLNKFCNDTIFVTANIN